MITTHDCARYAMWLFGHSQESYGYDRPIVMCTYGHFKCAEEVLNAPCVEDNCHVPYCDAHYGNEELGKLVTSKYWPDIDKAADDVFRKRFG